MKMTKQQAISLKLAQWLVGPDGIPPILDERHGVYLKSWVRSSRKFDPFANSTEGRAQFAECVIKASRYFDSLAMDRHGSFVWRSEARRIKTLGKICHAGTPEGIVAATLEAIYYAIDGAADAWSHSSENASTG